MTRDDAATSVFTDDSGSRTRVVTWTIRGVSCLLVVGAIAVGMSVVGQVTLPGLDSPLHIPGVGQSHTLGDRPPHGDTSGVQEQATSGTVPADTTSSTKGSKAAASATGSTTTPTATATATTPTATTPTAAHKPKGKPAAKPTTAANPTHAHGSGPTEPPGQSKKTTSAE